MSALYTQLLRSNKKEEEEQEEREEIAQSIATAFQRHYKYIKKDGKGRCVWGKSHPLGCQRKRALKRKFETNIVNSADGRSAAILGGSYTYYKCSKCRVWLYVEGPC
jgi:hypothetical protein